MFEFYRDLSAIGKIIFYLALLVVVCSVFYQCQVCSYIPLKLVWRNGTPFGAHHTVNTVTGGEPFENPSSLKNIFSSYSMEESDETTSQYPSARVRDQARFRSSTGSAERVPSSRQGRELAKQLNMLKKKLAAFDRKNRVPIRKASSAQTQQRRRASAPARQDAPKIILFYAPWCGHCKRFKPVWEKFVRAVKDKVKTVSVNGDEEAEMLTEYNVDKFPTIILERGKRRKEYDGDMTLDGLKMFIANERIGSGSNSKEVLVM